MLFGFIMANRAEIVARTRAKVAKRAALRPTEQEIESGVPLFLNQLAEMLRYPTSEPPPATDRSAAKRGAALSGRGYTVAQVVFDYEAPITAEEFQTLNECLDNAIAEAVTEYTRLRDQAAAAGETERSGVFAHELRNKLSAASLSYQCLKDGRAPMNSSVSAILGRSLHGMTTLLDRVLVEVRLDAGNAFRQRVHVHQLLEVEATLGLRGVSIVARGPAEARSHRRFR